MTAIFIAAYILFILGISLVSFFIVTRLQVYSINPKFTRPLIIIFIVVTIVLLLINIILFLLLPFGSLLPTTTTYPSNNTINY
jgi:hypothetical protein